MRVVAAVTAAVSSFWSPVLLANMTRIGRSVKIDVWLQLRRAICSRLPYSWYEAFHAIAALRYR